MKKLLLLKQKIFGGRIFKTGLSTFITALICIFFDLPVIFAVITAIVTVEPTASNSIKKGMIRFPAAAIGAGFAMTFEFFLSQSALTYALATVFTLYTLHKLKLDDGMLVATLTAVAMIPEAVGSPLASFLLRLSTTLIGISVSTIINFFILPPKFTPMINKGVVKLYRDAGDLVYSFIIGEMKTNKSIRTYKLLNKQLTRMFELSEYQRQEWKYHRHDINEIKNLGYSHKKLEYFQKIIYHIGNMIYVKYESLQFPKEDKILIEKAGNEIKKLFYADNISVTEVHYKIIDRLNELFIDWKTPQKGHANQISSKYYHHFSQETILLYELLSLFDVFEELERISERR